MAVYKETTLALLFAYLILVTSTTELSNVALGKPAFSSLYYSDGDPSFAVDGNIDGFCTFTWITGRTWWMVDLLVTYDVYDIKITNKLSFHYRLQDFSIYVSSGYPLPIPAGNDILKGQLCFNHTGILPLGGPQLLHCDEPIQGRYVYVWKPMHDELSICEFEVLAAKDKRETNGEVVAGQRSLTEIVYSKYDSSLSLSKCVVTCMTVLEARLNQVQVDKRRGMCECILFVDNSPNIVSDDDYVLVTLKGINI